MRVLLKFSCVGLFVAALFPPLPTFAQGIITTVAGNGSRDFSGDSGPATDAGLWGPDGVAIDAAGNLYIADTFHNRIRKVDTSGTISTIAGNGQDSFSGDGGPATAAGLSSRGIAIDARGNIYISTFGDHRVRKIAVDGTISTVAGIGQAGFSGDGGPATDARLNLPRGITTDSIGNLYIADIGNQRVRKVTPDGIISTIAGMGQGGYSGDGGPAISARLLFPSAVAVDQAGNIYIAESFVYQYEGPPALGNHRIRKVTPHGIITTVAGNGEAGFSGDGGPATSARLCFPEGIAVDVVGNLYITDSGNHRIRRVDLTGTIMTVAGGGHTDPEGGFSGDGGLATRAALDLSTKDYVKSSGSTAVDVAGKLFIADFENNRIRKVTSTSTPDIRGNSVVNAASFSSGQPVAPGSLVSIFGHFLAADTVEAHTPMLPTLLDKSSVTVDHVPAPLLYVSNSQINAQIPFEVHEGTVPIEVSTAFGSVTVSLTVASASPGIFTIDGSGAGQGAILTSTGELAAARIAGRSTRPARRGEFVSIYATGLGDVSNRPASGASSPLQPNLAETILRPIVTIGGIPVDSEFSGLAPNFVGLYQVNVRVPAGVPSGDSVPVVLRIGVIDSNTVTLAVQ